MFKNHFINKQTNILYIYGYIPNFHASSFPELQYGRNEAVRPLGGNRQPERPTEAEE
jgi:hypothetical protein